MSKFVTALVAPKEAIVFSEVTNSFAVGPLPSFTVTTFVFVLLLTRACASREAKPPLKFTVNGPPWFPVTDTVGLNVTATGLVAVAVALPEIVIDVEMASGTADAEAEGAVPVTVSEFANVALVKAELVLLDVVIVFANVTLVGARNVFAEIVTVFVLKVSVGVPLAVAADEIVIDTFGTTAVTVAVDGIPTPLTAMPTATLVVSVMAIVDDVLVVVPDSVN